MIKIWSNSKIPFFVVVVGICFSTLSFLVYYYHSLYIQEKKETVFLQKKIDDFARVISPYYEAESFRKPSFIEKKLTDNERQVKIPIIMYHYVEYVKDTGDIIRKKLDVAPHEFEGHLRVLSKAKYDTYFVKDIPDILNGTIEYSTKSAVLTFDDGYEDFYTVVYPLLKKYHMRATVYIIIDFIGKSGFLSLAQIKEMANSDLVEIGSHTLSHVNLKQVSRSIEEKQIIESKTKLEELIGIPIYTLAYPFGAFDSDAVEFAKKAGYVAAVTVVPGVMQAENSALYLMRIRPGLFSSQNMLQVIEKMKK